MKRRKNLGARAFVVALVSFHLLEMTAGFDIGGGTPTVLSESKISRIKKSGINRISLGIQSTNEKVLKSKMFENGETYFLPKKELFSKFIAISAYSGSVNIRAANSFLGNDILGYFKDELDFLLANDYVTIDDKTIRITKKGFEYYGAVFSLFYSPA